MTRAVAVDRLRTAVKAFIEAHRLDEGGDPLKAGHGGLVTRASIKAREDCARLLSELDVWDGIIEIIETPVPPNLRHVDGRLVVELYAGTMTMRAAVGDGQWLSRKARIAFDEV
jgi:hypothetical protein